jgi:hypothetical protein
MAQVSCQQYACYLRNLFFKNALWSVCCSLEKIGLIKMPNWSVCELVVSREDEWVQGATQMTKDVDVTYHTTPSISQFLLDVVLTQQ